MKKLFFVSLVLFLFISCSKNTAKNPIAEVGKKCLTQEDFDAFNSVVRNYPTTFQPSFPGTRSTITFMVETEAIFSKAKRDFAKGNIRSSKDWQWKKQFYPAQLYFSEVLNGTLGATNAEIESFYTANRDSFKTVIKIDSLKKDSVYYKALSEVKEQIAETLFVRKYKPDSTFITRYGATPPDQKTIERDWLYSIRNTLPDFLMKAYYKEAYGKAYPDSINEIYGKGKLITPEDFEVILSWLPAESRPNYQNPKGTKALVEWLLKWKLFSSKAETSGYSNTTPIKCFMDWAWKIEVVNKYVKSRIEPVSQSQTTPIDTSLVKYRIFDEQGFFSPNLSPRLIENKVEELKNEQAALVVDSIIFDIRKSVGVKFLQNDLKDQKDLVPSVVLMQADSARDSGNVDLAQKLYGTLTKDFSFTTEGKKALSELAKIQTEHQDYQNAIQNYRKFIFTNVDNSKKCNTFFMIGFIYDEYLDKSELAEANYKWLLKNTPDCELIDDAEFMVLHLGEPMCSVEELQAEAKRQGRKVETEEQIAPAESTDSSAVKTTAAAK